MDQVPESTQIEQQVRELYRDCELAVAELRWDDALDGFERLLGVLETAGDTAGSGRVHLRMAFADPANPASMRIQPSSVATTNRLTMTTRSPATPGAMALSGMEASSGRWIFSTAEGRQSLLMKNKRTVVMTVRLQMRR